MSCKHIKITKETLQKKIENGIARRKDIPYTYTVVRCLETGKEYYNIYAASEELGITCKDIAQSIIDRTGRVKYQYHFEVVDIIYNDKDYHPEDEEETQ